MIRIAICDDVINDIAQMQAHIKRYETENALTIDVKAFHTKNEIINALKHTDAYDLLFVDIYTETLNSIDLARQIKKNGVQSRMCFSLPQRNTV